MSGSYRGDQFDPTVPPSASSSGDPDPVRRDGVGPTEFSSDHPTSVFDAHRDRTAPTTPPSFEDSSDATRTAASVRGEDATQVYGTSGRPDVPPAYDAPSGYDGRGSYDPAPAAYGAGAGGSSPDTRPEDRFITGSTIDDDSAATRSDTDPGVSKRGYHIPVLGGWLLGLVRILIGWQFLWAFLDKTFGLGWSTTSDNAWINGGKPTQGYLSGVVNDPNNPFTSLFETFLGQTWADWLFMVGLAGIGIVLLLGLGKALTWFAALCGVAMYVLMYLAAWPAGHRAGDGVESVATNPFLDDHLLNAVLLLALAACNAGAYLGLAKAWRSRRAYKDA